MDSKTKWIIGGSILAYLGYQGWVRRNLDKYLTYWISSINVDKKSTTMQGSINIGGTLAVQNTSNRGILLSKISGDIFYKGTHVGTISTVGNIDLKPGIINQIPFIMTIPSIRLLTTMAQVVLEKYRNQPVEFSSELYFHLPFFSRVPFSSDKIVWK